MYRRELYSGTAIRKLMRRGALGRAGPAAVAAFIEEMAE